MQSAHMYLHMYEKGLEGWIPYLRRAASGKKGGGINRCENHRQSGTCLLTEGTQDQLLCRPRGERPSSPAIPGVCWVGQASSQKHDKNKEGDP